MALERYALIGLLFSACVLIADFYLIKKRKINASTFAIWLVISLAIGIFSIIPAISLIILKILGTEALISAITATGFLSLLAIIFYLHIMINDLKDKILKLTAEISSLKLSNPKNNVDKTQVKRHD